MTIKFFAITTLLGVLMMLSGCSSKQVEFYKDTKPVLVMEDYFNGKVKIWGIVQNYRGQVTRKFEADLEGTWNGNKGQLVEHFDFYDGEKQTRIWDVTKHNNNYYTGTAGDIIGTATGKTAGNAMFWQYKMALKFGDKTYNVVFDDWMFLMRDGVLINRSYIKKFGITVAELTIFMQKQDK